MRANVHTPWAQARKHTFVVRVLRQASTYLEASILDAHGWMRAEATGCEQKHVMTDVVTCT